jgi:hypothetical protein
MALTLDGMESGRLFNALNNAFSAQRFQQMLSFRLNLDVYDFVALNASKSEMLFSTIERTNQEWRTDELIAAARETNPTNVALHEFSVPYGLTSLDKEMPEQEFQRILSESDSFLNPAVWRTKLAEVESRVCRIKIMTNEGLINGTGFLVGPSVVLTNYHVMEPVILGEKGETIVDELKALPSNVEVVFDYKRLPDNTTFNKGVVYKLHADWLVHASPSSPLDELPPADHLDYALIRLAGAAGNDMIGGIGAFGTPRGWITIPEIPYEFNETSPVFIMQHPKGSPLKLAFLPGGGVAVNGNQTRVRHRVNTDSGSSGSPCFSQNWDLIALHHSGDPDFDPDHKPDYNEAIPIAAILDLLIKKGKDSQLGT